MRLISHMTFALFVFVCQGCSDNTAASQAVAQCPAGQHPLSAGCAWDPVEIAIGPATDASGCPRFSPNPASAHKNQLVQWKNGTPATQTVYQYEGMIPPKLLTTLGPSQKSAGEFWSNAGTITVFIGGCGSSSDGTITIAGGSTGGGGNACPSGSYCYQWDCHGDSQCLATNPNGTATGANDEGNDPSCSGLLTFGQRFWNIPPATQSCNLTP